MADNEEFVGLKGYFQMIDRMQPGKEGNTPWKFQLAHGKPFHFDDSSFEGGKGTQHMCFMNAGREALENDDLTYVEGYVTVHGIPIEHAWLVDKNGKVHDPTIRSSKGIGEYWGVPVQREYLSKTVLTSKHWGVFGMMQAYKYLEHDPKDIVSPITINNIPSERVNYVTLSNRSLGQRKRHGDPKAKYEAQRRKQVKKFVKEEMGAGAVGGAPTNSVAAGGVAGVTGEPPVGNKARKPTLMRRKANIVKATIKEAHLPMNRDDAIKHPRIGTDKKVVKRNQKSKANVDAFLKANPQFNNPPAPKTTKG